jgi:hypothetical protein
MALVPQRTGNAPLETPRAAGRARVLVWQTWRLVGIRMNRPPATALVHTPFETLPETESTSPFFRVMSGREISSDASRTRAPPSCALIE